MGTAAKALRLVAALGAMAALASCGDDGGDDDEASTDTSAAAEPGADAASGDEVSIVNFEFEPADLAVAAGPRCAG